MTGRWAPERQSCSLAVCGSREHGLWSKSSCRDWLLTELGENVPSCLGLGFVGPGFLGIRADSA